MSNKSSVRLSAVLLFVAFAAATLVVEDFGVLAQNANSSAPEESMQGNTNGNMTRRGRRRARRRARRAARAVNANANADAVAAPADANLSTDANASAMQGTEQDANRSTTGRRRRRRGRRGTATAAPDANVSTDANVSPDPGTTTDTTNLGGGTDEDLSGTYTGNVTMTGGHEMSGPGTLTITGNSFTLESGGMTHNGRIRAVTTRGYTGASLWFTDITDTATNTPLVASVRARKSGDRLTLSPVPGARNRLTFASAGGGGGRRRRGR